MLCEMVVGVVKMFTRLQQGLRRYATYIGTSTSWGRSSVCVLPFVDTRDLKTELCSTNGGDVPTGATANYNDVELFTHVNFSQIKNAPNEGGIASGKLNVKQEACWIFQRLFHRD